VDLSKEAIRKAKLKASKEEIEDIEFVIGDMREPLPKTFDAIVNLFTTFGYFLDDGENQKIISSTAKMLKPNGLLFLDYLNPHSVEKNLVPSESGVYENMSYQITRKIEQNMVYKTIQIDGDALKKPATYQERVKLYSLDWFKKVFDSTGYELIKTFGDYTGGKYSQNSDRLILLARLKNS
ncbi:class I SAM-dependent methyltransferase, partial [Rhodohalobacter halophilus]|uniref:class I SAM-dependent methyltransferase n=1 Tax=Rhodohalobacter halophilus TaxID=1812810 RepID=UPI00083FD1E2